ncbi:uncharacterized protein LOC144547938 [Carex rostrata]
MCYFSPNFILLLLLIQAFLANCCIEHERGALLEFKAGVNDKSSHLASWRGEKCCNWAGIRCNNRTSRVVKLSLRNTKVEPIYYEGTFDYWYYHPGLTGKISPSLLFLSDLKHLDLSFNNFSGNKFPEFISAFRNLKYLNLSNTGLSGMIHPHLGNLSKLLYFDLRQVDYYFSDFILSADTWWLSNMRSLKYIDMSGVDFKDSNNWVQSLNKLSSLEVLVLSDNNLTQIPNTLTLVNFTSLRVLHLSYQNFNTSTIPNWMGSLRSLNVLILRSCNLVGPYPATLGNLTNLVQLDLSGNYNLNGTIPANIGNLTNLVQLHLSFNNLNGTIPTDIGNLTNLVQLDLSDNNLNGTIPTNIGHLTNLVQLDLSGNNLNGTIPTDIGNLTNVVELDLRYNNLNGTIPTDIGNLINLVQLDLSYNNLNGKIPTDIGNLINLVQLDLSYNNLNGKIPTDIGNLINLVHLDLSYNNLNGKIPTDIGNLTNLVQLDLSSNNLNGTIPTDIGNLTNLVTLNLTSNNLNGKIPTDIGNLTNLVTLDLSYNSLTGLLSETHLTGLSKLKYLGLAHTNITISFGSEWTPSFQLNTIWLWSNKLGPKFPSWIRRQVQIENLDLSDTGIDDCIPDWVWSLSLLRYLWLSTNILKGKLPASLVHMTNLEYMDLSNNRLVGKIPFLPTSLSSLDLSNNSLSGQLRKHFKSPYKNKLIVSNNHTAEIVELFPCGLTSLGILDLSSNSLSGHLPPCWSNIRGVVNLANNRLSGVVPRSLSCSDKLQVVSLENNNLTGEFPFDLQFCKGLEMLDLGENNFHGIIPDWVGESFQWLHFLRLHSNLFYGNIPSKLTQLNNLLVLDLSNNNLSGPLPRGLDNFTLMSQLLYEGDNGTVKLNAIMKGLILEYSPADLFYLRSMDFSNNNITGEIPQEMVFLMALVNLNLSHNHLTGNIPLKIGNMTSLESLDFHMNNLSGTIPQSMSALYSLEVLNFSYNNLSGSIPTGHQLQALDDPSIYSGNPYLCGPPLKTSCGSSGTLPQSDGHNDSNSKNTGDRDKWLYLFIEFGFVAGFLVVFFILLFKVKWRYTYFQMVDTVFDRLYVLMLKPKLKWASAH